MLKVLLINHTENFGTNLRNFQAVRSSDANSLGRCEGIERITEKWRDHYDALYNSVPETGEKAAWFTRLHSQEAPVLHVSVEDIVSACSKRNHGKAVGSMDLLLAA